MASISLLHTPSIQPVASSSPVSKPSSSFSRGCSSPAVCFSGLRRTDALHLGGLPPSINLRNKISRGGSRVVCAVGDVSPEGTNYLIAGAIAIALVGTAYPILFSRKDLCPECDGAGFVRKSGSALAANAARKDLDQIVCARCNGLGKLGQVDK